MTSSQKVDVSALCAAFSPNNIRCKRCQSFGHLVSLDGRMVAMDSDFRFECEFSAAEI